jgi:hypothetical protein
MENLIDELALDVLPGDLRGLALEHLEGCTLCRGRLEELSESADELLLAYGPAEPPEGFEARVLDRLASERVRGEPARGEPARGRRRRESRARRRSWRIAVTVAAAAAAIVGLALAGGRLESGGTTSSTHLATPRHSDLRTVALIAADGHAIGDVSAYSGTPAWVFMRVDHGTESDTYQCVLDIAGGKTLWIGPMVIARGQGGWGEHVNVDAQDVRAARLVDDTGRTVATATFR